MSSIAIIPARGGSKRIPRKNIKKFMGKPMIAYAIEAAQSSNIFDEVMVSTEDDEIAAVAEKYGAKIPFLRSAKNASDYATTVDVVVEVLEKYKENGQHFDELCCIYPCVPFLTKDILKNAHMEFIGNESLIPVCKYPVPIEWALQVKEGFLKAHNIEALSIRSQDLVDKYYDVGMFYFAMTKLLQQYKSFVLPKTKAFIIDERYCQDIDTSDDWSLAENKYNMIFRG